MTQVWDWSSWKNTRKPQPIGAECGRDLVPQEWYKFLSNRLQTDGLHLSSSVTFPHLSPVMMFSCPDVSPVLMFAYHLVSPMSLLSSCLTCSHKLQCVTHFSVFMKYVRAEELISMPSLVIVTSFSFLIFSS